MKTFLPFFIATLFALAFTAPEVKAQTNRDYQMAVRLMQQHNYQEARPLLKNLHEEHPNNFTYAKQFVACLIQLKEYEYGMEVAAPFTEKDQSDWQASLLLGELHHYNGEQEKALQIWNRNIEAHPDILQVYVETGRTMVNRREYQSAVDVYLKARQHFQNNRLFFGDIANAYMQAGNYVQAIEEWLSLLEHSPNQITYIQRSLLRYNDPLLFDITIAELDDRLRQMSVSAEEYQIFYRLQIWLLQENKLFRRALSTAKAYESRTSSFNYSLFNLGRQLNDNRQFELATQAFRYYISKAYGEVKWRSMEELAVTYADWAKFIDDYNLNITANQDSLYTLSVQMLDSLTTQTQNYSRMPQVYLKKAELSLDHKFDLEAATSALTQLQNSPAMRDAPELDYLQGRIHLAKKEFTEARIAFTRANKQADIGQLAEKTRYFLALTDFFGGDYEFATIQLKSLGRQNTSFYANDALELRLWLQQGLSEDSTGGTLSPFAEAVFDHQNGRPEQAAELFKQIIENNRYSTLRDDAILFYAQSTSQNNRERLFWLRRFLTGAPTSPLKEKLLWMQASLTEKVGIYLEKGNCDSIEDCFSSQQKSGMLTAQDLYEQLILEYPQGFYAPYAREQLSNLTSEPS